MANLLEMARKKSADVKTMEIEVIRVIIMAMVPRPKNDLYSKEVVNEDGSVDISTKPLSHIDPAEIAEYKLADRNFMVKYQVANDDWKPSGDILTGFITESKIINPMTVWADVKAIMTFNLYTSKKGTPEEHEEVGIFDIKCSTENREFLAKTATFYIK